ncbi:MAG TPA: hypothetical protein VI454_06225 [Verrucomicrobiae bacterium]|jgi:hypothetical protein
MKPNTNTETNTTTQFLRVTCRAVGGQLRRARQAIENEFGTLRDAHGKLVNLALNEAEALACETRFPHLVFPTLAEEKLNSLAAWDERQDALRSHDHALASAV